MSDGAEVIEVTFGGQTFRAGRRTAAHLEWTAEVLAELQPDANLVVIQPCYNTDVTASAGTHDFDGVLDVAILGMDWFPAQRFLREHGWAAWYRFPPAFSHHIHMVSLGCPGPLGEFVPGQILDYHAHAFGLAGQHDPGSDHSWFPDDIDATTFDFQAWEGRMTPDDWKRMEQLITDNNKSVAAAVWGFIVRPKKAATKNTEAVTEQSAQAALKKAANG
jgi:hypothetical protein